MKFVIQRVKNASCTVENQVIGEIQQGFCVFIGVSNEDNGEIADKMIKKLIGMRIFEDENGKTNLSLADVNGSLLLISQFTLYADCKKGNRPSFTNAGNSELANSLYEYIILPNTKHRQPARHIRERPENQQDTLRQNSCRSTAGRRLLYGPPDHQAIRKQSVLQAFPCLYQNGLHDRAA